MIGCMFVILDCLYSWVEFDFGGWVCGLGLGSLVLWFCGKCVLLGVGFC